MDGFIKEFYFVIFVTVKSLKTREKSLAKKNITDLDTLFISCACEIKSPLWIIYLCKMSWFYTHNTPVTKSVVKDKNFFAIALNL